MCKSKFKWSEWGVVWGPVWNAVALGLVLQAITGSASVAMGAVIDQQSTFDNSSIGASSNPGQSFSPALGGIDFAIFQLAVGPGGVPASVSVDLLGGAGLGDGLGGALLGSSNSTLVSSQTFAAYEFDFPATLALTPGNVYTLRLNAGFQNLYAREGSGNPYTGGVEYDSALGAQPNDDLVFSEGVVPEPASLGLLSLGGVTLMRRRRESSKTFASDCVIGAAGGR